LEDPPLCMVSHEQRLEIGRRISARILDTFKENVLAVLITGSTAKAFDRPYSDLEMTVIVKDSVEIPTKFYVYDGLLIQIDYRQESEFLKAAREPGRDWPWGLMSVGIESYCLNETVG
jgi:predicted nucleotidyltransferase